MEILVNNEVRELEITDPKTGCNWEQDLIGNYDGFDGYDHEHGMVTMEPGTFDWWASYIEAEQDLQDRSDVVLDGLDDSDREKFHRAMEGAGDNDLDQTQYAQTQVVEEWEARFKDHSFRALCGSQLNKGM